MNAAAVAVLLAVSALAPPAAAQNVVQQLIDDTTADAVLEALREECYAARMAVQIQGQTLVCSTTLEGDERLLDGVSIPNVHEGRVRHTIRFVLAERGDGVRAWAYPSIEIEEPGGVVLDAEIDADEYLGRVRDVLTGLDATLGEAAEAAPREPWAEHYESEDDWRLDAHLRAVEHCNRRLDGLTREELERGLERAGVNPFGRSRRDYCEELYEPVFRWGLARGIDEPTVEGYADYRASLPPEQRTCTGRLALGASCP